MTGLAPTQLPVWHVSDCVQELPSLQIAPSALLGLLHVPVPASHVPASWHWSMASQMTGLAPVHVPVWQVSDCVQASPSLQLVPSALFGLLQMPVAGAQVPAVWHWSCALQVTGFAPLQLPASQVSLCVHALPSLQVAPSALLGLLHAPFNGSQIPASWHWSCAAQTTGLAPTQLPAWQEST